MGFTWFLILFWAASTMIVSAVLYSEVRKNKQPGNFIPVIVGVVLYVAMPFLRSLVDGQSAMNQLELHLQSAWVIIDALIIAATLLLLYAISIASEKRYVPVVWGVLLAVLAFLINAYAAYFMFFVAAMIQLLVEGDRRRKAQMKKILEANVLRRDDNPT